MKLTALLATLFVTLLTLPVSAQELPGKIRGYKVYDAKIRVQGPSERAGTNGDRKEIVLKIAPPELIDLSFDGITFEVGAGMDGFGQDGQVEFVTFRDIRINDIAVDIEEYKHKFSFKKNTQFTLPVPARVFIKSRNIAKGAFKEMVESKKDWAVTGTVFVFGTFRKFGFGFKRVVPIRLDLKIANPIRA